MAAFRTHRPLETARRQALLSRVEATAEATRALEAQLTGPAGRPADPDDLLVPAARALLGVLHRAGGGELVVSLGSDPTRAVRVRDGAGGPAAELVRTGPDRTGTDAGSPGTPAPVTAPDPDEGVAVRLAALLRVHGVAR